MSDNNVFKAVSCGGDGSNYFCFYSGSGYENNNPDLIANFAQENVDGLKSVSVDEIKSKHLYWASEVGYKGLYNGDTWVLFDDIEKLPKSLQEDARAHCEGYKNIGARRTPEVFDGVFMDDCQFDR